MISPGAEYVVSLGGEGARSPVGSLIVFSDRDAAFMCKCFCTTPPGESEDLPRGGKTPLAGGILVSLVGEGLPLWV